MLLKFEIKTVVVLSLLCGSFVLFEKNIKDKKVNNEIVQKINTLCSQFYEGEMFEVEIRYIPYQVKTFSNIEPLSFDTAYWAQIKMSTNENRQDMADVCKYLLSVKDTGLPAPKSMDTRWSIHIYGQKNGGNDMLLYGTGKATGVAKDYFVGIPKELDAWVAKKFPSQDVYKSRNEYWEKIPRMQKRKLTHGDKP